MTSRYRGRLAPSPTGPLHFGNARSALVAWLRARAAGGQLVMRIEDLDTPRVQAGATQAILDDLHWLGLDWDEGPGRVARSFPEPATGADSACAQPGGLHTSELDSAPQVGCEPGPRTRSGAGPHAPYQQSARGELYAAAIERLRAKGLVYPCTCSRREIAEVASAPHGELGALYPGTCRNGPRPNARPAALRFRMASRAPSFSDVLHGNYAEPTADDFVLQRGDAVYAYQLAVVVDDIAMGIREVVRGDDLMSSTPRQIALYRALEAEPPAFLHVPLVLAKDGRRLSKRHGAPAVSAYREAGLRPEHIIGRIAETLACAEPGEQVAAADLIERFDLTRVPRTAVRIDPSVAALART